MRRENDTPMTSATSSTSRKRMAIATRMSKRMPRRISEPEKKLLHTAEGREVTHNAPGCVCPGFSRWTCGRVEAKKTGTSRRLTGGGMRLVWWEFQESEG